jgi:hypothetical protein
MDLKIKLEALENFTEEERLFFYRAMRVQREVVNSAEFKNQVLNTYFTHTRGDSPMEIYKLLMSGYSNLTQLDDYCLNYFVTMYDSKKKGTLAWTSMSTGKIFVNRLIYKNWMNEPYGAAYCSSSMLHEYMHSIGYTHPWFPPGSKRKSVPYKIGYICRELGLSHLRGRKLTPVRPATVEQ